MVVMSAPTTKPAGSGVGKVKEATPPDQVAVVAAAVVWRGQIDGDDASGVIDGGDRGVRKIVVSRRKSGGGEQTVGKGAGRQRRGKGEGGNAASPGDGGSRAQGLRGGIGVHGRRGGGLRQLEVGGLRVNSGAKNSEAEEGENDQPVTNGTNLRSREAAAACKRREIVRRG